MLRGPQGTLFGAGSEGGTIRYITNQPSLTHFSGFGHAELAFTENGGPSYEIGVAEGGPPDREQAGLPGSAPGGGGTEAGSIASTIRPSPPPTATPTGSTRTCCARRPPRRPVSSLTITPGIDYQKRDQHNYDDYWVSLSSPGNYVSGTPDRMADPDRFYLPTLRVEYDLGRLKVISNTSYYDRLERVNGYSGTLYNLSFFQHFLSSDPSINQYGNNFPTDPQGVACANGCGSFYPLLTPTGPNVPGLSNYYAQNLITNAQQNFTQEFRVQSEAFDSRLQWTAGFFYAFDRQQSKEEIRDPMLPQLTQLLWGEDMITAWGEDLLANGDDYINNTRAHDRQEALFADATYAITEQLKLEIGLRYAWTKFVFANTNDGPQDLLGGPPSFDNGGLAGGGKSEQPFTPKFNLSYQLTADDLVYATASKGYRIGGATPPLPPNCGTGFPTSYNSDSLWSYEVGTKDRFLNRTLQVSASAFYVDWSNIQQAFYVPACGIQFTTNAGGAISKGFDLESQWQVTRALDLELTVGYTDARFSQTALDANGDVLNVKGDALDLPPWTVTVAAQYDFSVLDRDAFVRADYEFASKRTAPIPNEDPATAFYDPERLRSPIPAINQVSVTGRSEHKRLRTWRCVPAHQPAERPSGPEPHAPGQRHHIVRGDHLAAPHHRHVGELQVLSRPTIVTKLGHCPTSQPGRIAMNVNEIAQDLVALCKTGDFASPGEKYWADDVVSIEAGATPNGHGSGERAARRPPPPRASGGTARIPSKASRSKGRGCTAISSRFGSRWTLPSRRRARTWRWTRSRSTQSRTARSP